MRNNKHGLTHGELPPQPATLGSDRGHGHAASDGPTKIAGVLIIDISVHLPFAMVCLSGLPEEKVGRTREKHRSMESKKVKRY
jgi:hypothetical protein